MGGSGNNHEAPKKCGLTELLIFVGAIVSGTACSICSKTMMQLHGEGIDGDEEIFQKPIFQTFGMFVGMMFGLVMDRVVVAFKIPFPGYEFEEETANSSSGNNGHRQNNNNGKSNFATETDALLSNQSGNDNVAMTESSKELPLWMYFFLAIPTIFDLGATILCMMGLQYIDVSIYQLLRGSGIIFVALMKQNVLGDRLYGFQWIGIFWNVISVILVGFTAILNEAQVAAAKNDDDDNSDSGNMLSGQAFTGVLFVMAGAVVQAMQFVFEEKVMTMDIPSPPLLLIGMEGLWGTILCLVIAYPLAYYYPGDDHGSYEDPFNTWAMIVNSPNIQWAFFIYFFAIFAYNLLAVLVTFMLSSVWHAILDNFRPITVWGTDIFIFYVIAKAGTEFGEPWTQWSFLQLLGMFVLLYGTAIYNAPNAGSIRLEGQWYSFFIDMSREYKDIESEQEEAMLDAQWAEKLQSFKTRRTSSSFYGEHSPHISVHTQALRGLAAQPM